jgi:hypothetical protein
MDRWENREIAAYLAFTMLRLLLCVSRRFCRLAFPEIKGYVIFSLYLFLRNVLPRNIS